MKKQLVWMLAAILTLSGMTLTSCSEKDTPVNNNPLAEKLEGLWYAEYAEEGNFPVKESDTPVAYTKVIHAYKFYADGTGMWEKFFLEDDILINGYGDLIEGPDGRIDSDNRYFTYTSTSNGTITITVEDEYDYIKGYIPKT